MCTIVNINNGDEYDVYIGRGSKWGNPFKVEQYGRYEAIRLYKEWIKTKPELLNSLHELKGKRLGCHCKPQWCHGDVLRDMVIDNNVVDLL